MVPRSADHRALSAGFHRLNWGDLDAFARIGGEKRMVHQLRGAEQSRRKLLLYALLDAAAKTSEWFGPLPGVETVWELLARVEAASPVAFDALLAHPYTGSWAGYTTRLLRTGLDGVSPLWVHLGYVHSVSAAAAIRAGIRFEIAVPLWNGAAILPSLGLARLPCSRPYSVAEVSGTQGDYVIRHAGEQVRVPKRSDVDAPGWQGVRRVETTAGKERLSVRLDDVDPYRGLYEPVPPRRLEANELGEWRHLLTQAWRLLATALPRYAGLLSVGLDSLAPEPQMLFRNPSASTGEAFGSAVIGRPTDAASLAATLVHEFQHIVLGGVLHLTSLYGNDSRERIYVPWRDDPRPLAGAVQGIYAFFGVTAFWRALSCAEPGPFTPLARFEFAYWRRQTWHTLEVVCDDASLTDAGRRFLSGVGEVLKPWQHELVTEDLRNLAAAAATDHRSGWRLRHLRPSRSVVELLVQAWLARRPRPPVILARTDLPPTPVPDGAWSHARADLTRIGLWDTDHADLSSAWPTVPGATAADFAYVSGRYDEAAWRYRAELAEAPDRPASLVGLGLALAAIGPHPAARALLHCPELVRAVHRELRRTAGLTPTVESVASWIGELVSG